MAVSRRGRCTYTRFDREVLCAGTMTDWLKVLSRKQTGVASRAQLAPSEAFTVVFEVAGRTESVRTTSRWDGVNTSDAKTHVAYVPYEQSVFELDNGTFWIEKEGARNRYYRVIGVKPYGDDDQYIEIDLRETGFADLKAAEA